MTYPAGNAILKPTAVAQVPGDGAASPEARADRLSLPLIAPQQVAPLNAFYKPRPPLAFVAAGRAATFAASWPPAPGRVGGGWALDIAIDDAAGEMTLSRPLTDAIISALGLAHPLESLSPAHAGLLVELALSDALGALEERLGCRLMITAARADSAASVGAATSGLAFAVTVDGVGAGAGELRLLPRHAIMLARFLDRCAAPSIPADELSVALHLRVAAATFAVAEIAALSPGDVVMLDQCCRAPRTAVAVIAEHLVAPLDLTVAGAQVAASPMPGRGSSWEWSMQNVADKADPAEKSNLDDLPINLLFELGRLEVSLGEVRTLAPGALLPLARPLDDSVDILANGRRIGRGALVQIGDSLGVRITRLFGNV